MKKEIRLAFSFTDSDGETTNLEKTFNDGGDVDTIWWLLDEFKYFLKAMSFNEFMTDRIIYLEDGENVINSDGEVLVECKLR